MIRLVMSDLDGTLLRDDRTISKATIEALDALQKHGILFGIATGRSLIAVKDLIHQWGIGSYCDVLVGMNGAQFYNVKTDEMTLGKQVKGEVLADVIRQCSHLDVNFGIYQGNVLHTLRDDEIARHLSTLNHFDMVIGGFEEILKKPQTKMLILTRAEIMPQVEDFIPRIVNDQFRGFKSDKVLYEIVHPDVSKSNGIRIVGEQLGITMQEVMTFGDNNNDLEMVRDAGIGVAMANGTDDLKAVAKHVCLSNEEDGLAQFIQEFLTSLGIHE